MKNALLYVSNIQECVDLNEVWGIIVNDLPNLKTAINNIIRDLQK